MFYAVILPDGRRGDSRQNDLFNICGRKSELVARKVIIFGSSEAGDDSLMRRRVYGRKMSEGKSSRAFNCSANERHVTGNERLAFLVPRLPLPFGQKVR